MSFQDRELELLRKIEALVIERERLRAVVNDMLAGLAYLRSTNRVPYGFGIDRLEENGKAALSPTPPGEGQHE